MIPQTSSDAVFTLPIQQQLGTRIRQFRQKKGWSQEAFADILEDPLGRLLREDYQVPLIVFDAQAEVILRWIP